MSCSSFSRVKTVVLGAVLAAGSQQALAEQAELVKVDADSIFIPYGFDDNDEVTVVLDGFLRSGCYKLAEAKFDIDYSSNVIRVTQFARKYSGPCIQALVPFTSEVHIGVLPHGDFSVISNESALAEKLVVQEAHSAGPDDYLYAPIEGVTIGELRQDNNGNYIAFLSGRYTTNCMTWEKTKITDDGKTVVIQPVIRMLDLPVCEDATIPFRMAVDLPRSLVEGRHLVHTRSLNGRSVNTVFSVTNQ